MICVINVHLFSFDNSSYPCIRGPRVERYYIISAPRSPTCVCSLNISYYDRNYETHVPWVRTQTLSAVFFCPRRIRRAWYIKQPTTKKKHECNLRGSVASEPGEDLPERKQFFEFEHRVCKQGSVSRCAIKEWIFDSERSDDCGSLTMMTCFFFLPKALFLPLKRPDFYA